MRTGFREIPRNFSNSVKNAGFPDFRGIAENRQLYSCTRQFANATSCTNLRLYVKSRIQFLKSNRDNSDEINFQIARFKNDLPNFQIESPAR